MENVWDAIKLMLVVYGVGALVSFLVAGIIKLIYVGIRHGSRDAAPDSPAKTGSDRSA